MIAGTRHDNPIADISHSMHDDISVVIARKGLTRKVKYILLNTYFYLNQLININKNNIYKYYPIFAFYILFKNVYINSKSIKI